MRSDCLGDARNIIPNLSMSYRLVAACIISTAQQARPKVKGHNDPALDQLISVSVLDESHSNIISYTIGVMNGVYAEKIHLGAQLHKQTCV